MANSPYTDYRAKVTTKAHDDYICCESDGRLTIHTQMPPQNGLANQDIIRIVARYFVVDRAKVMIVRGHTEPTKTIRVYL